MSDETGPFLTEIGMAKDVAPPQDAPRCEHPSAARFVVAARQPLLYCNGCGCEYWGIDEGHGIGWQPKRGTGLAHPGTP